MNEQAKNQIFQGKIVHNRYSPKRHHFGYGLYMLALDAKRMEQQLDGVGFFGFSCFKPLWFNEKDYVKGEAERLTTRIKNKVVELNGKDDIRSITMLVQVRCFGVYFSPANFYFCYNAQRHCEQMLVEVSNTPWHQRHFYLVDLTKRDISDKRFQVSPFMDLNMSYHWLVHLPKERCNKLIITIENHDNLDKNKKIFQASLLLKGKPLTGNNIFKIWCSLPAMTIKIFASIYWQALRLFIKRIPFIGYQSLADKKRN